MVLESNKRKSIQRKGFSLVEVVIAIAVVSTALLPCVGLNAVSLTALSSARSTEASSRIFRSVLSEARVTEYSAIPQLAGTRLFDFEGAPIDPAVAGGAAVYLAEIVTFSATVENSTDVLPIGEATGLTVRIYRGVKPNEQNLISQRSSLFGNRDKGVN